MIVVSDASPLISLAEIGQLETLPELYRSIVITPEVYSEVAVAGHGLAGALQIATAAWIQVRSARRARTRFRLGLGELSTIALAKEVNADLTIIHDRQARRVAETEGLIVLGCVGVLETAFRHGLINDLTAVYRKADRVRSLYWFEDFERQLGQAQAAAPLNQSPVPLGSATVSLQAETQAREC